MRKTMAVLTVLVFVVLLTWSVVWACDKPECPDSNVTIDNYMKNKNINVNRNENVQRQSIKNVGNASAVVNQGDIDVRMGDTTVGGVVIEDEREYLPVPTYQQPAPLYAPSHYPDAVEQIIEDITQESRRNDGFLAQYMEAACNGGTSDVSIVTVAPLPDTPDKTRIGVAMGDIYRRPQDPFRPAVWPVLIGQANVTLTYRNAFERIMALTWLANQYGVDGVILRFEEQSKAKSLNIGLGGGFAAANNGIDSGRSGGVTGGPGYHMAWTDVKYRIVAMLYTYQDIEHALYLQSLKRPPLCKAQTAIRGSDGKR